MEQGIVGAQFNLGLMYYNDEGVTQDHPEAVKWFHKAAAQGLAEAQAALKHLDSAPAKSGPPPRRPKRTGRKSTATTYQGTTRYGRKTTAGHLSGRDPGVLPACTP